MPDFDLGSGEFRDPALLPEPLRKLHRAQMAQVRAERERRLKAASDEERRWPGLVKPKPTKRRRTR